nr:putative tRNA pseudouridine synthase Pus10 [Onthophagus taurus]
MFTEKNIYNHLRELGCCEICSVRYFCNKYIDLGDVNTYIKMNNIVQDKLDDEENNKKMKVNPCLVCLGLLQTESIDSILMDENLKLGLSYDSPVFTCSISMPACILLREHSMRLYLENKFPEFFTEGNKEIPLNRAWKMFVKASISKYLLKDFETSDSCDFAINISYDHKDDETELSSLKEMQPNTFQQRKIQKRKFTGDLFARKCVVNVLEQTNNDTFKKYYPVPPSIPTNFITIKNIECKQNPMYIAGRYIKLSRELSQSPWIIDGIRLQESSVQEIIFESITKLFNICEKDMKFSASGREDCDVRCIGKGRPFYIEIADPKRHLTKEEFKQLEKNVNESTMIKVRDLQITCKSDLSKIKEGEELKTKDYQALCRTKNDITQEQIDKMNETGLNPFVIKQQTPIRVLHRRPLAVRERTIHKMDTKKVEGSPYLFILNINTQAGTYVKEFVHGDFERTLPNIGTIIGDEAELIALDVVSINLDWPPEITY